MKNLYLVKILSVVKYNRSLDELLADGLYYSQIALLINEAIENNYVEYDDKYQLSMTEKGENAYSEAKKEVFSQDKSDWVLPDTSSRIEKIEINEVYLPRKKK